MTTALPRIEEKRLSLSMPIGAGLRKSVEIAGRDIHAALVFSEEQPGAVAGYQTVVANLLRADGWTPRRVFITSPRNGGGSTCTAFNLAWTLAAQQKTVLLVELNFARPRFRSFLGDLRIRHGVDSALRGSASPEDCVFSLGSDRLRVAAVRDAMKPAELKRHLPSLPLFLDWGTETCDWLILDCPPVLSREWSDWFRLHAEPSLLLVRERHTPLPQVQKAAHRLGAGLKGVLLNDAASPEPPAEEPSPDPSPAKPFSGEPAAV